MTLITPPTTRAIGTILTAAIYNADHTNHYVNELALDASFGNVYTKGQSDSLFAPFGLGNIQKRRMILGVDGLDGEDGPPGARGRQGPQGLNGAIIQFTCNAAGLLRANVNTVQNIFDTGQDEFNALVNRLYFFELFALLTRTGGTTSHTTTFLFGGTAVKSGSGWAYVVAAASTPASVSTQGGRFIPNLTTGQLLGSTNATAGEFLQVHIFGSFRVTTGGTFIPQFQYSAAPGGAPTLAANSYCKVIDSSATDTAETNSGWS